MRPIEKKLVTDEAARPVAVQIDYSDWLEIEKLLEGQSAGAPKTSDLSRFCGTIPLREEPLAYQAQIRGEWH